MTDSDKTVASVIAIRKAHPQDAAAIAGCLESAFAPFRGQYTPGAFADTVLSKQGVLDRMNRMTIHTAIAGDGAIIGTIASSALQDDGHLRGMAVRPEWQGHSIGLRLLLEAESHLFAAGCRRITLDTTLPLQRAMRFYERNGFVPSGRVTDFFGMPLHEYVKPRSAPSNT